MEGLGDGGAVGFKLLGVNLKLNRDRLWATPSTLIKPKTNSINNQKKRYPPPLGDQIGRENQD